MQNNIETDVTVDSGNYDYKILRVLREQEGISVDTYACHGYQLIHSQLVDPSLPYIDLSFQRDKKYAKNDELMTLDNETSDHLDKLSKLNLKLASKGSTFGLVFGIVGLLILGAGLCAVFLWQNSQIIFICGIVSIILGIIVVLLSFLLTKIIYKKNEGKIREMIKNEENTISEISLKALDIIKQEDKNKISQEI